MSWENRIAEKKAAVQAGFLRLFQTEPTVLETAPGRVNLIGEHTDYNQGLVLPMSIPHRVYVGLSIAQDDTVAAYSDLACREGEAASYRLLGESRLGTWLDYVSGLTWALRQKGHTDLHTGLRLYIASDVPPGSGLSSSAALMVALLRAMAEAWRIPLPDREIAEIAWLAETQHVGVPVGVMDPLACSLCRPGHALLLDTQNRNTELLPIPKSFEWIVIHSGVTHHHTTGGYRARRKECETAESLLGVSSLRELTCADLGQADILPQTLLRRVRHVVTENARVRLAVRALSEGDADTFGLVLSEAHRSLRDDFEVSVAAVDELVCLAQADPAILGARMTGGGFGGAVVMLARPGQAQQAAERLMQQYRASTGLTPQQVMPLPN